MEATKENDIVAEINTGRMRERERDEMRRSIVIDSASLIGRGNFNRDDLGDVFACMVYFIERGHSVVVWMPPWMKKSVGWKKRDALEKLEKEGKLVVTGSMESNSIVQRGMYTELKPLSVSDLSELEDRSKWMPNDLAYHVKMLEWAYKHGACIVTKQGFKFLETATANSARERYKIDKEKKSDVGYVGDMIKLMKSSDPEANKQFKRMLYERALAYLYGENLISEEDRLHYKMIANNRRLDPLRDHGAVTFPPDGPLARRGKTLEETLRLQYSFIIQFVSERDKGRGIKEMQPPPMSADDAGDTVACCSTQLLLLEQWADVVYLQENEETFELNNDLMQSLRALSDRIRKYYEVNGMDVTTESIMYKQTKMQVVKERQIPALSRKLSSDRMPVEASEPMTMKASVTERLAELTATDDDDQIFDYFNVFGTRAAGDSGLSRE